MSVLSDNALLQDDVGIQCGLAGGDACIALRAPGIEFRLLNGDLPQTLFLILFSIKQVQMLALQEVQ